MAPFRKLKHAIHVVINLKVFETDLSQKKSGVCVGGSIDGILMVQLVAFLSPFWGGASCREKAGREERAVRSSPGEPLRLCVHLPSGPGACGSWQAALRLHTGACGFSNTGWADIFSREGSQPPRWAELLSSPGPVPTWGSSRDSETSPERPKAPNSPLLGNHPFNSSEVVFQGQSL